MWSIYYLGSRNECLYYVAFLGQEVGFSDLSLSKDMMCLGTIYEWKLSDLSKSTMRLTHRGQEIQQTHSVQIVAAANNTNSLDTEQNVKRFLEVKDGVIRESGYQKVMKRAVTLHSCPLTTSKTLWNEVSREKYWQLLLTCYRVLPL